LSTTIHGRLFETNTFPIIGDGRAYVAAQWTVADGGTGDAWAENSTAGGGLLITTPSDDDFNMSLQSIQLFTPAASKRMTCYARFAVDDADKIGFAIGLGTTQVLNFTTDFTDKIVLQKAITATAMVGAVRGESGTAANSATLATVTDAGIVQAGFSCVIGSSAATSSGVWIVGGVGVEPFTAAQLTQLFAMLTTPQSLYFTINCTGVTGATHTLTVISAICEVER